MNRNKTQASQSSTQTKSQPSTSKAANQSSTEESGKSQLSAESFEKYINKCVRYIIMTAGKNVPIRKIDLQKHVLVNCGRNFDKILKEVAKILDKTYGYNLKVCDENPNSKSYIIISNVPYDEELQKHEDNDADKDAYKCLVMLVLSHIFMSDNVVAEASLLSFLKSLGVSFETRHVLFGNVKESINVKMVKQKYLLMEKDQNNKISYAWGPRAEKTISKHELLKFVCKMYEDRQPKHWQTQFEDASNQFGDEGNVLVQEEG